MFVCFWSKEKRLVRVCDKNAPKKNNHDGSTRNDKSSNGRFFCSFLGRVDL